VVCSTASGSELEIRILPEQVVEGRAPGPHEPADDEGARDRVVEHDRRLAPLPLGVEASHEGVEHRLSRRHATVVVEAGLAVVRGEQHA